jgi:hypothetical protein
MRQNANTAGEAEDASGKRRWKLELGIDASSFAILRENRFST